MRLEYCAECDEPTGKAGRYEDSLYLWNLMEKREVGPLCEECYEARRDDGYHVYSD